MNTVLQTYAFLDHGRSTTFCTENLTRRLKFIGEETKIRLHTMTKYKESRTHYITSMEISSLDEDNFIPISEVFTHGTMPVDRQNIPRHEDLKQWPYLKDVKMSEINSSVDLLMFTNVLKALEPIQIVRSQGGGPYATKTRLGWVIYCSLKRNNENVNQKNYPTIAVNQISTDKLEKLVMKPYNHDFKESTSKESEKMSNEELKFMDIMIYLTDSIVWTYLSTKNVLICGKIVVRQSKATRI